MGGRHVDIQAVQIHTELWNTRLCARHQDCSTPPVIVFNACAAAPAHSTMCYLQGNEFSYYMMIASAFVMNHSERAGQWALFPYVLNTCNQRSDADQLRQV